MNVPRKPAYLMTLAALGLSFAVSGHANDNANRSAQATGTTATAPATTAAQRSAGTMISSAGEVRASKLLGRNLENAQGQNVGEIEDLVIDTANGKVHYAVVGFGGFLGVGEKRFAFPLERFRANGDKIILDVNKEQLKDKPGFERNAWPDFNKADYRAQVDRAHNVKGGAMTNVRFVRGSQLLKGDVKDGQANDVGDIEDFVVNLRNGQVHYVVLEFDRAWNPNNKLVAMPMRALRSEDRDGTDLVYTASRAELETAPSFERNRWPDANDAKFRGDIDRYSQNWRDRPVTANTESRTRADAPAPAAPSRADAPRTGANNTAAPMKQ